MANYAGVIMGSISALPVTAGAYFAEHGVGSVSAAVRRWVAHPPSVRTCGDALGVTVSVTMAPGRRPVFGSLKQCRNRFVDPFCSWWWRYHAAVDAAAVMSYGRSLGLRPVLGVFTVSHRHNDSLGYVLNVATKSWSRLTVKSGWRDVKPIWLKALDVVVGGPNGPHPHFNVMMLVPSDTDLVDFAGWLKQEWLKSILLTHARRFNVKAAGAHGVTIRELNTEEDSDRWSRYALKDLSAESRAGFEVFENRFRTSLGGHTLMELAALAHSGVDDAGRLLGACAKDLEYKKSYTTSKSWTALAEAAGIASLDEDADADHELIALDDCLLALIPANIWRSYRARFEHWRDFGDWQSLGVELALVSLGELLQDLGVVSECALMSEPVPVSEVISDPRLVGPALADSVRRPDPILPPPEEPDPHRVPVNQPKPPIRRARSKRARA